MSASAPPAVGRSPRPALGPAVDPQRLTGDERAERPGEEFDHARHLVDRGDPLERAGLDQALLRHGAGAEERAVRVSPGASVLTVTS